MASKGPPSPIDVDGGLEGPPKPPDVRQRPGEAVALLDGIGDKHKLVPWQDVKIVWQKEKPVVRLTDAQLRAAERYQAPAASPRTDKAR